MRQGFRWQIGVGTTPITEDDEQMTDFMNSPGMLEAGRKLERDLTAAFAQIPTFNTTPIASIDSAEYAEDGATFIVTATLQDGNTLWISLRAGRPLSVSVHDTGGNA